MPVGGRALAQAARLLGRGAALGLCRPPLSSAGSPRGRSAASGASGGLPGAERGGGARGGLPAVVAGPAGGWPAPGEGMAEQRYCVDYAKRGTAGCKKCKEKLVKGTVRIGKIVPNPFTESGGEMKEWYHVRCMFEKLEKARATTKKIEDITDLEGWEELQDEEKELIQKHIAEATSKAASTPKKKATVQAKLTPTGQITSPSKDPLAAVNPKKFSGFTAKPKNSEDVPANSSHKSSLSAKKSDPKHKDCLLREFRKLCAMVADKPSYNVKTQIIQDFLQKGTGGDGFHGDVYLTDRKSVV